MHATMESTILSALQIVF